MRTIDIFRGIERKNVGYAVKEVKPEKRQTMYGMNGFICNECGEYFDHITIAHANRHGFKNVTEMMEAGAASRRWRAKPQPKEA